MTVLFTGATGFLGSRVLRLLLQQDSPEPIVVLGRDEPVRLRERLERALTGETAGPLTTSALARLRYVQGDVARPGLGLADGELDSLAQSVTTIWHSAALLALKGDPTPLFRTNVLGTRHVLELADRSPKARLAYVSTAYVAGARPQGHVLETELSDRFGFQSYYQETKFTVERMIHQWALQGTRSAVIMRPSLLVVDHVVPQGLPDQPLGVWARLADSLLAPDSRGSASAGGAHVGALRLRADPESLMNVVQVDYAAQAMVRAEACAAPGVLTVHVTHPCDTPMGVLAAAFQRAYPGLDVTAVATLNAPSLREAQCEEQLAPLLPLAVRGRSYDRSNLLACVAGLPDPAPVDVDYLARALKPAGAMLAAM